MSKSTLKPNLFASLSIASIALLIMFDLPAIASTTILAQVTPTLPSPDFQRPQPTTPVRIYEDRCVLRLQKRTLRKPKIEVRNVG